MIDFEFIEISPITVELGWRFDTVLPKAAEESMAEFAFGQDFRTLFFSPRRTVSVATFQIATCAVPWNELLSWEGDHAMDDLHDACQHVESELVKFGWRLPTEDEFEIAAGGELFAWGNEIPDGSPYPRGTRFTRHKDRNSSGLQLNDDPYKVELVSTAMKMGDGGVSICGGEPWPIAWLSLSPAYRTPKEMVYTAFPEYLETVLIRPVLL